jgi:hypothetical protein
MNDVLRCRLLGCRALIHGITGLQELEHLIQHFRRKHGQGMTMATALEVRVIFETVEEAWTLEELMNAARGMLR